MHPDQHPDHASDGTHRYKVVRLDSESSKYDKRSQSEYGGERVESTRFGKQHAQAEEHRQIGDDSHHRRRYASRWDR